MPPWSASLSCSRHFSLHRRVETVVKARCSLCQQPNGASCLQLLGPWVPLGSFISPDSHCSGKPAELQSALSPGRSYNECSSCLCMYCLGLELHQSMQYLGLYILFLLRKLQTPQSPHLLHWKVLLGFYSAVPIHVPWCHLC